MKMWVNNRLDLLAIRVNAVVIACSLAILLIISSLVKAQQEIVITWQGVDPLLNYAGFPDQLYEIWQGTNLLDIATSDVNGNYELRISQNKIKNSSNAPNEYSLSHNYPEPFLENTKLDLVIPDNTIMKVDIFNTLGQRVGGQQSFSVFPGNYWLDISGLFVNGFYFVRVFHRIASWLKKQLDIINILIFPLLLNKQVSNTLLDHPEITLSQINYHYRVTKVEEDLTIKVRSIGLTQYMDDEVSVEPKSKILNFVRIRIWGQQKGF